MEGHTGSIRVKNEAGWDHIKKNQCTFGKTGVRFLGRIQIQIHRLSSKGVQSDPDMLATVQNMQQSPNSSAISKW